MPREIVVSASAADSDQVFEALALGAIDVVTKPNTLATDRLYEIKPALTQKVKMAATAIPRFETLINEKEGLRGTGKARSSGRTRIVVVGTSTGGPQAFTEIFKTLPKDFPVPLVIALRIPAGYTAPLAARISK